MSVSSSSSATASSSTASGSFPFNSDSIPPQHAHRTMVLCFDGTGDKFGGDNSNVVNFFGALKKNNCKEQLVYYQTGIGTYVTSQAPSLTSSTAFFDKLVDKVLGVYIDAHVMAGYEYIMQNYEEGDKICIFGFSRGAYTARALAGMIHKVGLLPRCNFQQVPFAYKMYARDDAKGWAQSVEFKAAFSIDVKIEFLGVWDTVGAIGIFPRNLPFTCSNTHVRHFRHALALDERRVRFIPIFGQVPGVNCHACDAGGKRAFSNSDDWQDFVEPTDAEEVWFAGCHADVGGGSVANNVPHSLARIPLRWMIRQCFLVDTGIMFDEARLRKLGMDGADLYPYVKPRPPPVPYALTPAVATTEEEEDALDAMCDVYDQLSLVKVWWLLELIPAKLDYHSESDRKWTFNCGRPRRIPITHLRDGVKVHRSVKLRMEAKGLNYEPRAKWPAEPIWTD
ncbi:hypothetical protein BDZ89DRAFT_1137517 [Hymenopellis radicata]|nr:hypothetical protein BDZ89DRAFT_1137517 [Hymenopellis radicata]